MCIFSPLEVRVLEPVTVYKVVIHATYMRKDEIEDHWISPYMKCVIPEDIIKGEHNMIALNPDTIPGTYTIDEGYIHSYMNLEDAVKEYYLYYKKTLEDASHLVEVYECEIPADTGKYGGGYCWWGYYGYEEYSSMAAREIKFVRRISAEELFAVYNKMCENIERNKLCVCTLMTIR